MVRTLALPLRVDDGGVLATLEQGSRQEVAQSVGLLLATRPGERRTVPGYGLPDPLFGAEVDLDLIVGVVAEWEDRADDVTVAQAAADDHATRNVTVNAQPPTVDGDT